VGSETAKKRSAFLFFIHRNDWHPGGNALSQLSRWQRLRLWFLKQRHKLLERYQSFYTEAETYAILAAMTLGDKSAQTQDLREAYVVSGASHILAISGLHVGIVYMLLTWFMLGRRHFWLSQVVTVSAIWAFALLTGLSPSVTRAATMISIYAVFAARGGKTSGTNVLCFAAIVILVADVQSLFDVSFQLSFAAVLAILVFMPLMQRLYQPRNTMIRWTWNLGLLSLCAQLGVAPLIAYYFGRFSVYFLLSNFLVIPTATLILYGALLSLLFPPVSIVLIYIVKAMNGGLRIIASLPGASIEGLHPTPLQVALIYVFIVVCYLILRKLTSIFNSSINMRDRRWQSPRG
jgi:competence protein ComEC